VYIFFIISRSVLFRMRNVSGIIFRDNENTNFRCSNFNENGANNESMWKNPVESDRPQMPMHPTRITSEYMSDT